MHLLVHIKTIDFGCRRYLAIYGIAVHHPHRITGSEIYPWHEQQHGHREGAFEARSHEYLLMKGFMVSRLRINALINKKPDNIKSADIAH
jgi:hypothetical protein